MSDPLPLEPLTEAQFDGLVGPTHNYAGLSPGNIASEKHQGSVSNPKAAAVQGIAKMRMVASLGVLQAVLPPHPRPSLAVLRQWGFRGRDEDLVAAAAKAHDGLLLRLASSASAMWTANAATVAPSRDSDDGRAHFVVANLSAMTHRSLEAPVTESILKSIFSNEDLFEVHPALPGQAAMGDEGAANHTRLVTSKGVIHLFAWGRRAGVERDPDAPKKYVARQSLEGSMSVARLLGVAGERALFARQSATGIDAGGFHTDVLGVGNERVLLIHEHAFANRVPLVNHLKKTLGDELCVVEVSEAELPAETAIRCYPFNSQLLTLPGGTMAIIAPAEAERDAACKRFLDRVVADSGNPVSEVRFVDLRESMQNGGGPACLRLRVPLTQTERSAIKARVWGNAALFVELEAWVNRHYRDRLRPEDLADPALARESMTALDELTRILQLGSVYDFQHA
ncbi:MAG: N-succinylarginine dihydrolase [Polyangiaceae bacterium]